MNLSHDALTLRFDTRDAPAPAAVVPYGDGASLTVGVEPPNPGTSVDVRYRVDGGPIRTLTARELRTDYDRGVQYFVAKFPNDLRGEKVEYCPVASCAGRQVPQHGREGEMLSSFVLAKKEPAPEPRPDPAKAGLVPRFTPELLLVAQVDVQLNPPIRFGKTPLGLRIDYHSQSGTVIGPGFRAEVVDAVDYMLVRPDGMGLLDIRATLKTEEGALISAAYGGTIEFGEDGYERMASGRWPELPSLQISPRLVTEDPHCRWFNRTHFLGVGQVDMRTLIVKYDLYAVGTGVEPGAWRAP